MNKKEIISMPVDGFLFDGKIMRKTKLYVNYTSDNLGKTLSITDLKNQFTIPFDDIYDIIK